MNWWLTLSGTSTSFQSFVRKSIILMIAFSGTFASFNSWWWPFNIFPRHKSCIREVRWAFGYTTSWCPSWYLPCVWREQILPCIFFCPYNGGWLCTKAFAGNRSYFILVSFWFLLLRHCCPIFHRQCYLILWLLDAFEFNLECEGTNLFVIQG